MLENTNNITENCESEPCKQRINIILNYFQAAICDWDFASAKIKLLGQYTNVFGEDVGEADNTFDIFEAIPFHFEDYTKFQLWLESVRFGKEFTKIRLRICRNSQCHQIDFAAEPILENGVAIRAILIIHDVTEELKASEKLKHEALIDALSGLHNQRSSTKIADAFFKETEKNHSHALFLLDLDDFKSINDTFGHVVGDKVIARTGRTLRGLFRATDILGRVGGDEFMAVMRDCSREDACEKAREVCDAFERASKLSGRAAVPSVSIGVALWPVAGVTFGELFAVADKAMYASKAQGKNAFTIA